MPKSYQQNSSRSQSPQDNRSGPQSRGRGGGRFNRGTSPNFDPSCQIYIARFSSRTTDRDLRAEFERFGEIVSIDVKDRRCFAFIVYQTSEQASNAINGMNDRSLNGQDDRLVVEMTKTRPRGRRSRSRSPFQRGRGRGRDGPRGDACFNCGREGHWAQDCREDVNKRREDLSQGKCFTCGEIGHKRFECPSDSNRRPFRKSFSRSRSPPRRRQGRSRSRENKFRRRSHGRKERSPSSSQSSRRSRDRKNRMRKRRRTPSSDYSRSRSTSSNKNRYKKPIGSKHKKRRSSSPPQKRKQRDQIQRDERHNSGEKRYRSSERVSRRDDSYASIK